MDHRKQLFVTNKAKIASGVYFSKILSPTRRESVLEEFIGNHPGPDV